MTRQIVVCLVSCCAVCLFVEPATAQSDDTSPKEISLDELLLLLDARRELVPGFEWQFSYERRRIVPPTKAGGDLQHYCEKLRKKKAVGFEGGAKDPNAEFSGSVLYDAQQGRYSFTANHVQPWEGGEVPYIGVREKIAFDGTAFWDTQWSSHDSLPPETIAVDTDLLERGVPHGTIKQSAPRGQRLEQLLMATGFCFLPGYMALPESKEWGSYVDVAGFLRELQNNGQALRLSVEDTTQIRVSFDVPDTRGYPEDDGEMEILFRLDQSAAIEHISFTRTALKAPVADYKITNREIQPGIWFPSVIDWGNWQNPLVTRVTITEAQVVKSFEAKDFQLDFMPGTQVTDHRNQISFRASSGPVDEAAAVREYAATFLGQFDPKVVEPPAEKVSSRVLLIIANAVFVTLGMAYWAWRRRKTSLVVFLILSCGGFCPEHLTANDAIVAANDLDLEWSETNGWVLPSLGVSDGHQIRVAQCGFYATCLALETFKRSTDPVRLSRYLKPTKRGIRMDKIASVLRAHQLHVEARADLSWNELAQSLTKGVFAIVATPERQGAFGHYFGLVRLRDDSLLLLDPPLGVKKFSETLERPPVKELVVLFVSEISMKEASASLSFPKMIELHQEGTNWTDKILGEFSLKNSGRESVWISTIRGSCGCIKIKDQPIVLAPGESGVVKLEVNPRFWGDGKQQKSVWWTVDDKNFRMAVEGEFVKRSGGVPDPGSGLQVVALPFFCQVKPFVKTLKIATDDSLPTGLALEPVRTTSWCEAQYSEEMHEIEFKIHADVAQLERVRAGENVVSRFQLTGRILAATYEIRLTQDLSAIAVETRTPELADDGTFKVHASLKGHDPDGWDVAICTSKGSSLTMKQSSRPSGDGDWEVTATVGDIIARPTVFNLEFRHPDSLPLQLTCVLLPP